ncbi:hypothetical protein BHM03_00017744, partial [Ensete ventricosum]
YAAASAWLRQCGAAACAASAARGCLRVRSPLDASVSACDRRLMRLPPCAVASVCDRRLMRLPLRSTDPASAWAVGSVVDVADLYAHLVLSQADPAKKKCSKIAASFPRCTTIIKNRSQAND